MLKADRIPQCAPSTNLADIWEKMMQGGVRVVAIKDQNQFLGLITLDDLTEVIQVVGAAMEGRERRDTGGDLGGAARERRADV